MAETTPPSMATHASYPFPRTTSLPLDSTIGSDGIDSDGGVEMLLYDRERVMKVVRKVKRSIPELERIHGGVRIDESAVICAAHFAALHYKPKLFGEELIKKVLDIVGRGCELLKDKIKKDRNEKFFDELENVLHHALVEHHEIVKERDARNDCYIRHLEKEINFCKKAFASFRKKWKFVFFKPAKEVSKSAKKMIDIVNTLLGEELTEEMPNVHCCLDIRIDAFLLQFPVGFMDLVTLSPDQVGEVVCRQTGIPCPLIDFPTTASVREEALQQLGKRLFGLDHVISALHRVLLQPRPRLRERRFFTTCPIASFLFVGSPGSGRAEVARGIARYFFSDINRLIRIDTSEYRRPPSPDMLDSVWKKFCVGRLIEALRDRPCSLIYFDKIDKTDPCVVEILIEILDKGALIDSHGNKIEFSNSIIIMSCVVGPKEPPIRCTCIKSEEQVEEYSKNCQSFQHNQDCPELGNAGSVPMRIVKEAECCFDPDLLLLIDEILVFPMEIYRNKRAVSQIMLRGMVEDSTVNDDVVVHASGSVLEIGWLSGPMHGINCAKRVKNWLDENVVAHLSMIKTSSIHCPSLYIDTLAGTKKLSFRLETSKTVVEDWFFKNWKETLHEWRHSYQMEKAFFLGLRRLRTDYSQVDLLLKDLKSTWNILHLDSFEALMRRFRLTNYSRIAKAKDVENIRESLLEKTSEHVVVNAVKSTIVRAIDAAQDLPNRPAGVFMCVGLDAKSKMELVSGLAENLHVDGETLLAPNFGLLNDSGGVVQWMLDLVKKKPYSVFLFEEIGSADPSFYLTLLKILDNGVLSYADGSFVDFRCTTFILIAGVGDRTVLANLFCSFGKSDGKPVSYSFGNTQQDVKPFRSELPFRMHDIFFFEPSNLKHKRILRLSLTKPHFKLSCGQLLDYFYFLFRKTSERSLDKWEDSVIKSSVLYLRGCGWIRLM